MRRPALCAHTAIVVAASIVIAVPLAYAGWSLAAFDGVQLRPAGGEEFSMFDVSNGGAIEACNTAPLPVSISGMEIAVFYQDDLKGTYRTAAATLMPHEISPLEGSFTSELYAESRYLFLHMDGQFGGAVEARLDPGKMRVVVTATVPLLGFIPLTASQSHAAADFYRDMDAAAGTGC